MPVTQVFQISVFLVAGLTDLVLAVAEGGYLPGPLALPIVVTAYFFSEKKKTFHLTTLWTNLLGLVAFFISGWEFMGENVEGRILSASHLLFYLQFILLFQESTSQKYWWLCALGLLQMAVASVLTNSFWFGPAVILYLLLSVWTLCVFSLYRAVEQFSQREMTATEATRQGSRGPTLALPASTLRHAVCHDPQESWINRRFAWGVAGFTGGAFLVGVLFFLFTPRVWVGDLQAIGQMVGSEGGIARSQSGFTNSVRLGDIGQILESTVPVMRVQLRDSMTNAPLDVEHYASRLGHGTPLFRTAVMWNYREGQWEPPQVRRMDRLAEDPVRVPGVVQKYDFLGRETLMLPVLQPFTNGWAENKAEGSLGLALSTGMLVFPFRWPGQRLRYNVLSPLEPQPDWEAEEPMLSAPQFWTRLQRFYLEYPQDRLSRLKALATELTQDLPPPEDPEHARRVADKLVGYLRDSGRFSYSMDLSIANPRIDPVEDFLFNRRQGHCEYFASSLALMLRAAGVPARLVSGFKGGFKNELTGDYEVQERHAHAWVEAFANDHWIVLDPTPADEREAAVDLAGRGVGWWSWLRSRSIEIWQQYFISLSLASQQQNFYEPVKEVWKSASAEAQGIWTGSIPLGTRLFSLLRSPSAWFSVTGFLVALAIMLPLLVMSWLLRRLIQQGLLRHIPHRRRGVSGRQVQFYERLESLLARAGLRRQPAQTQREFLEHAEQRLNGAHGSPEFPFSQRLGDLFYRLRFGGTELEPAEEQQTQQLLQDLAAHLKQHPLRS